VFFDWFDAVGVEDFPAVFAGEIVERFNSSAPSKPTAPGVVLAAIASVDDVSMLTAEIRSALSRFQAAGIRETRVFKAFDDGQEVLILQEIDDEDAARRWIEHPDEVARWMTGAGIGAYPPLFVGKLVGMMRIDG
jgi:heme-degrading monooxygenase HmoA